MSKLFFDDLLTLSGVEKTIKSSTKDRSEQEELWGLVDEIVAHKVIGKILDNLPSENHGEFMELFHKCPYDEVLIYGYLDKKTGKEMKKVLKKEFEGLEKEILKELNG